MYIPPLHKEDRIDILHEAIRAAGLATLVTLTPDGLIASHVPMLLEPEPAPYGTLLGHVARPNAQAKGAVAGTEALAIFLGPDAYITPSWYETKRQTAKVVPTWNYVAIHAYGTVEFFNDRDRLLDVVTRLTNRAEAARAEPWAVNDAPADFIDMMLKGIVGFAAAHAAGGQVEDEPEPPGRGSGRRGGGSDGAGARGGRGTDHGTPRRVRLQCGAAGWPRGRLVGRG